MAEPEPVFPFPLISSVILSQSSVPFLTNSMNIYSQRELETINQNVCQKFCDLAKLAGINLLFKGTPPSTWKSNARDFFLCFGIATQYKTLCVGSLPVPRVFSVLCEFMRMTHTPGGMTLVRDDSRIQQLPKLPKPGGLPRLSTGAGGSPGLCA